MSNPRARQMLDRTRAGIPALSPPEAARISVPQVLTDLADAWPGEIDEQRRSALDALCRKIAVAGEVFETYGENWGNTADRAALSCRYWPLLIAVLLAWSEPVKLSDSDHLGRAYKNLNGGLTALDIAEKREGISHLAELRSWSEDLVRELSFEVSG